MNGQREAQTRSGAGPLSPPRERCGLRDPGTVTHSTPGEQGAGLPARVRRPSGVDPVWKAVRLAGRATVPGHSDQAAKVKGDMHRDPLQLCTATSPLAGRHQRSQLLKQEDPHLIKKEMKRNKRWMFLMVSQMEKQMVRRNQGHPHAIPPRLLPPSWGGAALLRGLVGKELLEGGCPGAPQPLTSTELRRAPPATSADTHPSQLSQDAALEND